MVVSESGSLKHQPHSPYKWIPLIKTTTQSGTAEARYAPAGPDQFGKMLTLDPGEHTIAGILQGEFKTAFPDGPSSLDVLSSDGRVRQLPAVLADLLGANEGR